MSDYPPFLTVGTEISAKFKGAFCEARIKKAIRCVKCRVTFKDHRISSCVVDEHQLRGPLRVGASVEVPHPETRHYVSATIQHIKDCSTYTVIFDDGDERVLRRRQMCIKGGRHFDASESLDVMPLTKPEQFGAPVRLKSGGYKSSASGTAVTALPQNKSVKPEPSDLNSTSDSDSVDSVLGKKPKELTVGTKIRVRYGTAGTGGGTARSALSAGAGSSAVNSADQVAGGGGGIPKAYGAKIVKVLPSNRYKIHYLGWNTRYDEIIDSSRISEILQTAAEDEEGGGGGRTSADSSDDAPPSIPIGQSQRSSANQKKALDSGGDSALSSSTNRKRRFSNGGGSSTPTLPSRSAARTDSPNLNPPANVKTQIPEKSEESAVTTATTGTTSNFLNKEIKKEIDDIVAAPPVTSSTTENKPRSVSSHVTAATESSASSSSLSSSTNQQNACIAQSSINEIKEDEKKLEDGHIQSATATVSSLSPDQQTQDSNVAAAAVVRRISKRLRGENPSECEDFAAVGPQQGSRDFYNSGSTPAISASCGSSSTNENQDQHQQPQDQSKPSPLLPPTNHSTSNVNSNSHVTSATENDVMPVIDNLFDRIMRQDLVEDDQDQEDAYDDGEQEEEGEGDEVLRASLRTIKMENVDDDGSFCEEKFATLASSAVVISQPCVRMHRLHGDEGPPAVAESSPLSSTSSSSAATKKVLQNPSANDDRSSANSRSYSATGANNNNSAANANSSNYSTSNTSGNIKRPKNKRRRRNYSQMVTENTHRKPTVKTPRRETTESDNESTSKPDSSTSPSKDSNNFHALKLRVQAEMDRDTNYRPIFTFDVIDENLEPEQKIQLLQQRLTELKETYAQVKTEATYLERKRKKILEKKRKQLPKSNKGPPSSNPVDNRSTAERADAEESTEKPFSAPELLQSTNCSSEK